MELRFECQEQFLIGKCLDDSEISSFERGCGVFISLMNLRAPFTQGEHSESDSKKDKK